MQHICLGLKDAKMLKTSLKSVSLALGLVLGGCAVPGGHIVGLEDKELSSEMSFEKRVSLKEITPELLKELKQAPKQASLNPELDKQIRSYDYKVGVGDVLNVTVWDHPELTIPAGSYRDATDAGNWVHADGTIYYPYAGKIKVAGKSITSIRKILEQKLNRYIEQPQVDVTVAAFRSQRAYITGEVNQPGSQAISNIPLTLLDAVNQAGGLSERADWRNVVLTHNNVDERINLHALYQKGDLTQNRLLHHNDVIHIPRNDDLKVFVMGEVTSPETLTMDRNGMTLAEAISSTGGIQEASANASGIFVVRNDSEAEKPYQIYQLNAKSTASMVLATQFSLKPYDVVYVTAMPVSRWNRVISQLIPTISAINSIDDVANW